MTSNNSSSGKEDFFGILIVFLKIPVNEKGGSLLESEIRQIFTYLRS
jgi:hypothetical protein